jgi:hypothetical protein
LSNFHNLQKCISRAKLKGLTHLSVLKLDKKPDCVTRKPVLTDQLYCNSFPMSKLRLCLFNVIETSNVVFLLNSGLSPFNSWWYRIRAIFSRSGIGCPLLFFAKASLKILCVNFSLQTVMRNDSADDLERLDAANLHWEMHCLLLLIPHTNMTTLC